MSYDPIVNYKQSATGKNPRLLWRTVFGSGVTKAASDEADGISFFEDLSGTDSVTEFDYNADLKTALACGHVYPAVQSITDRTSKKVGGTGNLNPTGIGSSSDAHPTAAIDTSAGTAQLTLSFSPATANEVCAIEAYEVVVS